MEAYENNKRDVAEQMMDYLIKRAEVEGVPFELPLEVFQKLCQMTNHMFGIEHDGTELICDHQEPYPGFFDKTKREILGEDGGKSVNGMKMKDSADDVAVKFVNTDCGEVKVMDHTEVVDELVDLRRSDLEDELENDIECYENDLEGMTNLELAKWHSDYLAGEVEVMDRTKVIDELVDLRRSELEDELENDIECYENDLEEMTNLELAKWHSDYMAGEMRVEVWKAE